MIQYIKDVLIIIENEEQIDYLTNVIIPELVKIGLPIEITSTNILNYK
jgi:hypothetical protein